MVSQPKHDIRVIKIKADQIGGEINMIRSGG